MRIVTFKTLEGRNFLSFGDDLVAINLRPGVNAIVGTNLDKEDSKNGAGKSSVLEILYYSLYGTTLREISKDHVQNSLTKKRCEVSLEFSITSNNVTDEYKISRMLNPSKCVLLKNGQDITRSTLVKTNQLIQELIHTPATVFQNSVVMSVNTAQPFMALPKTDKRKFIESVLGLEVFTQMVLLAREDFSTAKKDYEIAYSKFEQLQNELVFNESQFDNYEGLKQERINKLHEKKAALVRDIEQLQGRVVPVDETQLQVIEQELEALETKQKELQTKLANISSKRSTIAAEIKSENRRIHELSEDKDKCPTCSRDYSEEHVKHVSDLIQKHRQKIQSYTEADEKVKSVLAEVEKAASLLVDSVRQKQTNKQQISKIVADNKTHLLSIKHLESNMQDVEEDIAVITQEQNNELKGKIAVLKTSVDSCKEKVDKLNNDLNVLETVKFVISEEGIKSFIVKKILKVLNSRLAYYLKKLEANCLCQFNEFFDEEIIDENSQTKSYFNFSGGERKRIDLACLFAFADIRRLQGDVNFSTVFYDELLDSSLDDKGVSLTLKVLRERFVENNESCYIITHRGPEVTTKAEHTIHVTKRNGISAVSS
jgi:DNA repair exonuclease SbcCD ATPase subunit